MQPCSNSMSTQARQGNTKTRHRVVRGGAFIPDAERCQRALDQSGRSREEVAHQAGLCYGMVVRLLRGQRVSRFSARALARAMRVRLDDLAADETKNTEAATVAA